MDVGIVALILVSLMGIGVLIAIYNYDSIIGSLERRINNQSRDLLNYIYQLEDELKILKLSKQDQEILEKAEKVKEKL